MHLSYIGRRTLIAMSVIALMALMGCLNNYEGVKQRVSDHMATYKTEMDAYVRCNAFASRAYASQTGDPVSIAFAARGACIGERNALKLAVDKVDDPVMSAKIMAAYEQTMLEQNSVSVVDTRHGH